MTNFSVFRFMRAAIPSLVLLALLSLPAVAQIVKVEGLIKARNGDTIILQTSDSPWHVCDITSDILVSAFPDYLGG